MRRRGRRRTGKFSDSWFGRWLEYRAGIRERFCSKCNQPYVQSPEAKPEEQFFSCSAAALVYPTRRSGRKDYLVRLGRWRPNGRRLDLVQMFDADDVGDLLKALLAAQKYIAAQKESERAPKRGPLRAAKR
ncbi:hypothetical protein [Aeoliella sp.]|uniref:hypothetical protein n=1 Tax=Aeoliella sp. TaxID=2795800 RepID=UPI003CCB98BA